MIKETEKRKTDTKNEDLESKDFEEQVLEIRRVTKVTEGGKNLRFRAALVVGNHAGKVGFGLAKGLEVPQALAKAKRQAMKNLIEVPIIEETIPFEIKIRFKKAELFLKPASGGTGLIAGRPIRPLIELAGIRNILSKIRGSNDKIVNSQAVILAFKKLAQYWKKMDRNKISDFKNKKLLPRRLPVGRQARQVKK